MRQKMAMHEFNPNQIAADIFVKLLKEAARTLTSGTLDVFRKLVDDFKRNSSKYVANTVQRCSYVKTVLINKDTPAFIGDVYVKTYLSRRGKLLTDNEVIQALPDIKSLVIEGTAGSGKSMFMRYLFLSLCERPGGRLPLFVELRQVNNLQTLDLATFILHSVADAGSVISPEQFDKGMTTGAFTMIFDGYDEIDFDKRKLVESQIMAIRVKYPDIIIVISSRPDPDSRFGSWSRFHVYRVQPMNQQQITELIRKLDYDKDVRSRFLRAMKEGQFDQHKSFLSNPLLSILMLITYERNAHIPEKTHIFYEYAFEALFSRHDASKQISFQRRNYSGLAIDDFRNCFSAFCVATYAKEKFVFTSAELRDQARKALEFENKNVKAEHFISDLIESVCMLEVDGPEITFTHRSFQEYFSAMFIARCPPIPLTDLLDPFSRRREDTVITMAFEMNKGLIEREWALPKLQEFVKLSEALDAESNPYNYAKSLFGPIGLRLRGSDRYEFVFDYVQPSSYVWSTLFDQLYRDHFVEFNKNIRRMQKRDIEFIEKKLEELRERGDGRLSNSGLGRRRKGTFRGDNSRKLALNESDNVWLRETHLRTYFVEQSKLARSLLRTIESNVSSGHDVLSKLFD